MAAPAKFLFDTNFAAPDKSRERPTQAEVAQRIAAAEAKAYRDGYDAGQREAKAESDRRTALALEEIKIAMQGIAARFAGVERRMEWGVGPGEEERARYAHLLPGSDRRTVAFVVGTSKPEKEWPAERYAAVADALHAELGARTILVGGKSERETEAAEAIRRAAAHPPLDLREWDLRRVAYLLDRADALVWALTELMLGKRSEARVRGL